MHLQVILLYKSEAKMTYDLYCIQQPEDNRDVLASLFRSFIQSVVKTLLAGIMHHQDWGNKRNAPIKCCFKCLHTQFYVELPLLAQIFTVLHVYESLWVFQTKPALILAQNDIKTTKILQTGLSGTQAIDGKPKCFTYIFHSSSICFTVFSLDLIQLTMTSIL